MDRFRATNDQIKPMPGIAVSAAGEGGTFSATANDRGEFVLTGLRLGAYNVTTKVPQGYESLPARIEIPRSTRLRRGRADRLVRRPHERPRRRSNGTPIGHLPLELVPARDLNTPAGERFYNTARSNDDGTFELRRVGPGDYVVAVAATAAPKVGIANRALYAGAGDAARASTIAVGAGSRCVFRISSRRTA